MRENNCKLSSNYTNNCSLSNYFENERETEAFSTNNPIITYISDRIDGRIDKVIHLQRISEEGKELDCKPKQQDPRETGTTA